MVQTLRERLAVDEAIRIEPAGLGIGADARAINRAFETLLALDAVRRKRVRKIVVAGPVRFDEPVLMPRGMTLEIEGGSIIGPNGSIRSA